MYSVVRGLKEPYVEVGIELESATQKATAPFLLDPETLIKGQMTVRHGVGKVCH